MRIGFRINYQKCDSTYMALQIARLAQELAFDVEIFPFGKHVLLNSIWDKEIVKGGKPDYPEWAGSGLSHIVYTVVPTADELKSLKARGTKTTLLTIWDQIEGNELPSFELFDHVIAPAKSVAKLLLYKLKLDNVHCIPWDPGVPITIDCRDLDPKRLGIIWPLDGSQAASQETKFISVAEMMLECCPDAWLTVVYAETLSLAAVKELRKMAQYADGRIELLKNASHDRQELLFGHHDLTVWPSLSECSGLTGLTSIYMGTPVIAFDHPVIGEVVKDNCNGELVPCNLDLNDVDVPSVQPNYPTFGKQLVNLIKNPDKISMLREATKIGLRDRRETFNLRLKKILMSVLE